jgi:hypothetical protein
MHQVTVRSAGGAAIVTVDGVDIGNGIAGLDVCMRPARLPLVRMEIVPLAAQLELGNCELVIEELRLPENVERLLLEHLQAKYGGKT